MAELVNAFDQFDAMPGKAVNAFDQFDGPKRFGSGRSMDVSASGELVPTRSDYGVQDGPISDRLMSAGKNAFDAVGNAATGVVGGVAGDVAGLGALVYDTTANAVMHPLSGSTPSAYADPAAVRERVSRWFTHQPSNPESIPSKVLRYPGTVMSGAGDYLASFTDNPYAQDVLKAVPQAAASYLGVKAAAPIASREGVAIPRDATLTKPDLSPEKVAIKGATDAGYKLTPTQVGNKVGGAAEGISGQAQLERSISKSNVAVTDSLAKKAVGIADDKPLTGATIGIERAKANKSYDAVAKTGVRKTSDAYRADIAKIDDRTGAGSFAEDVPPAITRMKEIYGAKAEFDAADAVAKIRQLRKDARANIKTRDPEKAALGYAQKKVADALDSELERHVIDLGKPQLVEQYRAARVQLAKLGTVEDALAGTNVSAKKIHQQWKRGAPLEGDLLTIAKAYDSFPHVLQEAAKIRAKHPFSVVDALVAAGGAAVSPPLLATIAARPLTRAALASDFYQRRFVQPRGASAVTPNKPVGSKPAAGAATNVLSQDRERARR